MDWDLKLGRVMDEEGVQRTARRRRTSTSTTVPGPAVTCLVDGCTWDLSSCRDYHRRHRVCERHSKTPVVLVGGQEQRFCQQCSRFHSLGEFDEVKRSCRKRLDGHNRRRRKTQPESMQLSPAASSSPAPTTTGGLFPPAPPLFHHLIRHPPLPPSMYQQSSTAWPVAAPAGHPFPQAGQPSHSFGNYVSRQHDDDVGHIDCALSLLSSGTDRLQGQQHMDWQQQQQGFDAGGCSSSGGDCYGFDDVDQAEGDGDGAPNCRMFPFSWD